MWKTEPTRILALLPDGKTSARDCGGSTWLVGAPPARNASSLPWRSPGRHGCRTNLAVRPPERVGRVVSEVTGGHQRSDPAWAVRRSGAAVAGPGQAGSGQVAAGPVRARKVKPGSGCSGLRSATSSRPHGSRRIARMQMIRNGALYHFTIGIFRPRLALHSSCYYC